MDPLTHAAADAAAGAVSGGDWYVHDLSPFIIPMWSDWLPVRWYGLAYVLGAVVGALLLARWSRRGRLPIPTYALSDFALVMMVGVMGGGRLGYCIFYEPRLLGFDGQLPFWGVLRLWDGGMASHGGIAGMVIAWWWYCRRHRLSPAVVADAVAAAAPIGVVFGRLANFINGELWGHPTTVPWAVVFPHAPLVDGEMVPRHPYQLYAVGLEGLLILAIVLPIHAVHRRPGVSAGLVLMLYAIGRFIGECFREPDKGMPGGPGGGERILGLFSMGQFLTLFVAVAGLAVLAWAMRRPARPELYPYREPPAPTAAGTQ